jgi:hypothetical protein
MEGAAAAAPLFLGGAQIVFDIRVLALAGALIAAGAPGARADWFGALTLPDRTQLITEVADSQEISPGKPFVARVTRLDGRIATTVYVPVEIMVEGDAVSAIVEDTTGNRFPLAMYRRPSKGRPG